MLLQRIQFGKSSEKLREKTARQVREAEERISALQEEMAEVLGEQHDPALPQPLRQSSARKPLPASLPRETPHAVAGRNHLSGMRRRTQRAGLRRIGAAGAYQQRL